MHCAFRAALLASVAALALTDAAFAQGPAEILVTARRTEENLQNVPGSVSAFSNDTLRTIGAADTTGLQGAVPNLNIVQGRGSSNATNIYIRGVGQPDALQTFDPAVGFYVDDVYYSRIRGTQLDIFDVARVEVLRGPQGTLYGKNTIGGALKIVTKRPGHELHGSGSVTGGEYGEAQFRVGLEGGLTDTLAGSITLFDAQRNGYVTNPTTGAKYNDRNAWAGRAQLAWDPSSVFRVDFALDYAGEKPGLVLGQATNTLTTILGVPIYVVPTPFPTYDFTAVATAGLKNQTQLTHWGWSVNASWDISERWTLKSITAHRSLTNHDFIDIDATPVELGDVFVGVSQEQTSEELQAIYESPGLTLVGGIYYLKEDIASHQEAYADDFPGGFLGATSFLRTVDDDLSMTSWAGYANASFPIHEKVNLSFGIRQTHEEKDYFRTTSTFSNAAAFVGTFAFTGAKSWTDTSPMVSVDIHPMDNAMLYGKVARGFKSGGFNGRANNPGEDQPYDPEVMTSYEVGAKHSWYNDTLIFNLSWFWNFYKDFQARVSRSVTSPSQPIPAIDFAVLNAGSLHINGGELEFAWQWTPTFKLDSQVGYLEADYKEFFEVRAGPVTIDRSWQTPAFSPKWTLRFGASKEFNMFGGTMKFAGSARYRSRMALSVDNSNILSVADSGVAPGGIFPGMWQDGYWLYDANAVWTSPSGGLSLGIYGRNLSDTLYRTDAQEFSSVGKIRTAYYGAPETISFVISGRF